MNSSLNPTQRRQEHAGKIQSIDDACLIHIFSFLTPLPDLFNAARTCKRFHTLALTHRNWLVVRGDALDTATATPATPLSLPSIKEHPTDSKVEYRQQFTSLSEAVEASRPGDTILLNPGRSHSASGVVISHPLSIRGGGSTPEETVLFGLSSCVPVLTFSASSKLGNLTIEGGMAGCVAHTQGRLAIENCVLRCHAKGLRHLASPLLALATTATSTSDSLVSVLPDNLKKEKDVKKETNKMKEIEKDSESALVKDQKYGALKGGFLSVVECQMEGGSTAVRLRGSGGLRAVRVIYEARKALFWFEVDSSDSSSESGGHGERERSCNGGRDNLEIMHERSGGEGAAEEVVNVPASTQETPLEGTCLPSWLSRQGFCGFDPIAFQTAVGVAMASTEERNTTTRIDRVKIDGERTSSRDEGGSAPACDTMLKKSELWRIEHSHCAEDCEIENTAAEASGQRKRRRC